MSIVRAIFWIALFLASTFSFLVIFDQGITNFPEGCKKEIAYLQHVLGLADKKNKKDGSM